ncbi:neuronal acetylcholine receptor subunit beta-2-like [Adelges cooleyi]|uniref:neuronal acetylcholine receptor subunit beta-2-like n=1 Tax=Adelges cooleyi TaxID=133065 RepID=UPI00218088FE|nr:neuronal acetylcholine receptor subunit beta-2-like [Adelges cooleyi]
MDVVYPPAGLLLLLTFHLSSTDANESSQRMAAEQGLRAQIFNKYDKVIIPAAIDKSLLVDIQFVINSAELNYETSQMILSAWFIANWKDDRLTWIPNDYDYLKAIVVNRRCIWFPDIMPYNNIITFAETDQANNNCQVNYNGSVSCVQPVQYNVHCQTDMTYWPYDTQTAVLRMGSWMYNGAELNLTTDRNGVEVYNYHSEWDVQKVTNQRNVRYYTTGPNGTVPFIDIEYSFTIKRKTHPYYSVIYVPALCSAIFNLIAFWIPYNQYGKTAINLLNALFVSVVILIVYSKVPLILSSIPLIVIYYTYCLGLIAVTAVISMAVKNMITVNSPLPHSIRKFIHSSYLTYLGIKINDLTIDCHMLCGSEEINMESNNISERQKFAKVIDRICFTLFTTIYFIMLFRYVL